MWMTLALLTPDASACGGFACNQNRPVLQAAERIVFGVDEAHDLVEMHVQITYTGDAEDFAWIVPVPEVPDLFVTSGALFNRLAFATAPRFVLNTVDEGWCREDRFGSGLGGAEFALADATTGSSSAGGVNVIDQKVVGPYETVTLRATSSEELLAWLAANAFDLPPDSEKAIAPYVSEDGYFVALKLTKDADVGDLAPLALRYEGDRAIVPVQLTSVSATPDMRLEAYVFANTRAVPESYLHVQINDAAIDWWNNGANYPDVITEAANEAGGHAFATDYYGPSSIVRPLIDEAGLDEASIRAAGSPEQWIERIRPALPIAPPELFELLEDEVAGVGDGNGSLFFSCPDCLPATSFVHGVGAATDALMARVIEPARVAQNLLDQYPLLSRMTSSLDAAEMTVDPTFVLNHDMKQGQVSRRRVADQVFECGNGRLRFEAPRRLVLADGREIDLPSQRWMGEHGTTELEYLEELGDQKAQVIEQTGQTGAPEVIADFTADLFDLVDAHNAGFGCGCDSTRTAAGSVGSLAVVLALALRRRR